MTHTFNRIPCRLLAKRHAACHPSDPSTLSLPCALSLGPTKACPPRSGHGPPYGHLKQESAQEWLQEHPDGADPGKAHLWPEAAGCWDCEADGCLGWEQGQSSELPGKYHLPGGLDFDLQWCSQQLKLNQEGGDPL